MNHDKKTTLVFLPGWGFRACVFEALANAFEHYPVMLLDLPLAHTNDTEDFLITQLNTRIPENAILIGWSLGGLLASKLCSQFPGRFKALITLASNPQFVATDTWPGIPASDMAAFLKQAEHNLPGLMQHFLRLLKGSSLQSHLMETGNTQHLLYYLHLLAKSDLREVYRDLSLPVLHVFGDQDPLLPLACEAAIQQHYTHRTHVIQHAGHILFHTHRDACLETVHSFIKEVLPS